MLLTYRLETGLLLVEEEEEEEVFAGRRIQGKQHEGLRIGTLTGKIKGMTVSYS